MSEARDYVALMQAALAADNPVDGARQADAVLVTLVQELGHRCEDSQRVSEVLKFYHPAKGRHVPSVVYHVVVGDGIEEALTPEQATELVERERASIRQDRELKDAVSRSLVEAQAEQIKALAAEVAALKAGRS